MTRRGAPRALLAAAMLGLNATVLAQWAERGFVVLRRAEWLGTDMGPRGEQLGVMADEVAALAASSDSPSGLVGPFPSFELSNGSARLSRVEAFVDHHAGLDAFLRGDESPVARLMAKLATAPTRKRAAGLAACSRRRVAPPGRQEMRAVVRASTVGGAGSTSARRTTTSSPQMSVS